MKKNHVLNRLNKYQFLMFKLTIQTYNKLFKGRLRWCPKQILW